MLCCAGGWLGVSVVSGLVHITTTTILGGRGQINNCHLSSLDTGRLSQLGNSVSFIITDEYSD